jgi:hypothetical protein
MQGSNKAVSESLMFTDTKVTHQGYDHICHHMQKPRMLAVHARCQGLFKVQRQTRAEAGPNRP